MSWNLALNPLRDVLADLYPREVEARRIVATAGMDDRRIAFDAAALNTWQSILEEAEKQEYVEDVIAVAVDEYPRNRALRGAVGAYRQSLPQQPSPAPTAAPVAMDMPAPLATPPATPAPVSSSAAKPWLLDLGAGVTLRLARVSAGAFLMGSADTGTLAFDFEKPQHRLTLPTYLIGKYPVTVAQFRAFVQATHYPIADQAALDGPDNHPVVRVTWHEAMTFCEWAAKVSGRTVRLPSEAEWEKAARGAEGRIYPWGNRWDAARCNTREAGPCRTTPVGYYSPLGDSPYGCADMAGNVWEWTRSLWGRDPQKPDFGYPYDPGDGRESPDEGTDVPRVVRGGAFLDRKGFVRCAYRYRLNPHFHNLFYGFRVVVIPISL